MVQFDPKLIVFQIVALQSFYYVAMGVFLGSFRYEARYCRTAACSQLTTHNTPYLQLLLL